MSPTYARPELLVSPDWVTAHLERADLRIVDCRWRTDGSGRTLHAAGHIPGAAFLDWRLELTQLDQGKPHHLAPTERVAEAMGALGAGDGTTIVLYDDTNSLYAGRVWWSLIAHGVDIGNVRILDGGWPGWLSSGGASSTAPVDPARARLTLRPDPQRSLSTAQVRERLGAPGTTLIDGRTPNEFRGRESNLDRLGHLPGAVNLPAALLVDEISQAFPSPPALDRLLDREIGRSGRFVVYDAIGVGAAKIAFALMLTGREDVAVYEGGWTEWASDERLPVE